MNDAMALKYGVQRMSEPPSARPRSRASAHGFRLQWEPVQNCHVLLYPEGMVKLNGSAGEIMKRCDGQRSVAAIVAELERAFPTQRPATTTCWLSSRWPASSAG